MNVKVKFLVFFTVVLLVSCKSNSSLEIVFLDEFVIDDSIRFKNTVIGGLSGIDYHEEEYFLAIDDDDLPRVVTAKININKDTITEVVFQDVLELDATIPFVKNNVMDLESVFIDEHNHINVVSEGSIKKGRNPSVFSVNKQGLYVGSYALPEYFKANSYGKPRHSAVFEASCKSYDRTGFWVGMEGVLGVDGNAPSQKKEILPARITYYNTTDKKVGRQFAYPLDNIQRPPKGKVNVNGVTAILEYAENQFFIVERSFQSGYGNKGNMVRIYKVILNDEVTDTFNMKSLKDEEYTLVDKELVFDFETVRGQLTNGVIDNVEGMTLGPKLSNGNSSLILVTDDNFQEHSKQLNQFILLEINE